MATDAGLNDQIQGSTVGVFRRVCQYLSLCCPILPMQEPHMVITVETFYSYDAKTSLSSLFFTTHGYNILYTCICFLKLFPDLWPTVTSLCYALLDLHVCHQCVCHASRSSVSFEGNVSFI